MPGGGTWVFQNKQRPGTYINFVAVPKPLGKMGNRGVVAVALPMKWGPEGKIIELLGTDLLDGKSLPKVGCTAFEAESLPYRLALAGCYKALLFRADTGGTKSSLVIAGTGATEVKAIAKYPGVRGDDVSVKIVSSTPVAGKSTVTVYFKTVPRETFVVDTAFPAQLEAIVSEWVDFSCGDSVSAVPALSTTALDNGADGTVTESTYTTFFNAITTLQWQCLAIDSSTDTAPALIAAKIKSLRDTLGKKVQGVVYNSVTPDHEGIISVKQGFKTATETIPVNLFPLYVASITAGAQINESNTAIVVPDAVEITNPVSEDTVENALSEGWFILTYRQDGAVCVEQDINCFHTFTADKGYAFSKNRVIRTLDEWANQAALIFNRNYAGKQSNTAVGRNLYKGELIHLGEQMEGIEALKNFSGAEDVVIAEGDDGDAVVVEADIQPVDSMEKLYMTVKVG